MRAYLCILQHKSMLIGHEPTHARERYVTRVWLEYTPSAPTFYSNPLLTTRKATHPTHTATLSMPRATLSLSLYKSYLKFKLNTSPPHRPTSCSHRACGILAGACFLQRSARKKCAKRLCTHKRTDDSAREKEKDANR